jgi:hypothetical protein
MVLLALLVVQVLPFPLPCLLQTIVRLLAAAAAAAAVLVQTSVTFMAVAAVAAELLMVLAVLGAAEQGRVQVQEERVEQPV